MWGSVQGMVDEARLFDEFRKAGGMEFWHDANRQLTTLVSEWEEISAGGRIQREDLVSAQMRDELLGRLRELMYKGRQIPEP